MIHHPSLPAVSESAGATRLQDGIIGARGPLDRHRRFPGGGFRAESAEHAPDTLNVMMVGHVRIASAEIANQGFGYAATASISISQSGLTRAGTEMVERATRVGFAALLKEAP